MNKQLAVAALALLVCPVFVSAAGIEVSPSRVEIDSNASAKTELIVANPTADAQNYKVYADEFSENIKVSPENFTLEPGARKKVALILQGRPQTQSSTTEIATRISVIGSAVDDTGFSVATGVKIPVTIKLSGQAKTSGSINYLWFMGLMVFLLGAVWYSNRKA